MGTWDELLKGKVALVTGGSRGIGRADALALADAGADVAIADIHLESDLSSTRTEEQSYLTQLAKTKGYVYAEQTVAAIRAMGRRAMAVKCDVSNRAEVDAAFAKVTAELGPVDILVNNAGVVDHLAKFEQQTQELWDRDLRVNLTGSFHCAQAAWTSMKQRKWGRIVNVASIAGTLGSRGQASYATTKAGVLGLTKTLAIEGARSGITVNAVIPGMIASEAMKMGAELSPEGVAKAALRSAFGRPGEPEDVAAAVVFLASEKARYITGVGLYVSGGIELLTT